MLDSNSSDDSVSIASLYGARVISIKPSEFNHGLTRNRGVQYAVGEFIYFTVQDAELASVVHLEKMISHFQDEEVQGVVGIQGYPHRNYVNPALWFKQFDEPIVETRDFARGSFGKLTKEEQFSLSNWDNVNAMYRKSALIEIPFVATNFSEDWIWANQALKAGMKLLRDPSILVWHYHHMTFGYTLKSTFVINYYFYYFFNQLPSFKFNLLPILQRTTTLIFKRRTLKISDRCYWLVHNYVYFTVNSFSVLLFRIFYLFANQKGIDYLYKALCGTIPQGKIK